MGMPVPHPPPCQVARSNSHAERSRSVCLCARLQIVRPLARANQNSGKFFGIGSNFVFALVGNVTMKEKTAQTTKDWPSRNDDGANLLKKMIVFGRVRMMPS